MYKCKKCGKIFLAPQALGGHALHCGGMKKEECKICGEYIVITAIRKHTMNHQNDSDCPACGKLVRGRNIFCSHSCAGTYNNRNKKDKYDWEEVGKFYNEGNNQIECSERFGFGSGTFHNAVERGALKIQKRTQGALLEEIMVVNSTYSRCGLKRRLLEGGLLENKCSICGITEWMGKPLIMVLDHINGINNDHRLENLRMVCQNCGSQLPTFAGRNIKRLKDKVR